VTVREAAAPLTVAPPIVHEALRSPGRPLEPGVRKAMEARFAHDFSRVRVHTDGVAAKSARTVGALAYTVGDDIAFGRDGFAPGTPFGRRLIAHELAHVVQQDGSAPAGSLRMEGSGEGEAIAAERAACSGRPVPRPRSRPRAVARFVPEAEVEVETESEAIELREGQRWVPDPWDNSLQAMMQRAAITSEHDRNVMEQERPVATLDRGGTAPDFVTERGTRRYDWIGGPGGGGTVTVRNRRFHVLDAIEDAVGRATTDDDLQAIADQFFPAVGALNRAFHRSRWWTPSRSPRLLMPQDVPVYPQGFDPRAEARLQIFEAALARRAQQVPSLAQSTLAPRTLRRGGCLLEPILPMGNDPLSALYCHAVTGSPYSYKITILGAGGARTQRWAEIDALRGNTWYECKCGYERLLTSGAGPGVLDRMDHQVLNHVDIARTCGLTYRFVVSNDRVRRILEQRWFGNVVIDVVPWGDCD
jgi:uncharacterized protein DUF4157